MNDDDGASGVTNPRDLKKKRGKGRSAWDRRDRHHHHQCACGSSSDVHRDGGMAWWFDGQADLQIAAQGDRQVLRACAFDLSGKTRS